MTFPTNKRFALLISLCLIFVFSQIIIAGDDWRPVTPEELAMKKGRVEADADAEAIFWEVRINDSSSSKLSLEHYVRVKILTERGREKYSKFDIPYTKGMKIKGVAARVIKPDGTIVEILDKDIFERDIIKVNKTKVKAKSFAVPNIEPGVIVEYQYQEIIKNAGAVGMKLSFQKDIPVQKISYFYKPYNKKSKPRFQSYNFTDTKFIEDNKGFYLAERKNVPAFKEEPRMPPEDMVRPWMLLQGIDFSITGASFNSFSFVIKDPGNPANFWGGYGIERKGLVKFMLDEDKDITNKAKEITASAKTDEEKLQKLYDFVQTEIKNTTFDSTLTEDERDDLPKIKKLDDVLKKKQASSQFIDMLFGAMANSLGLETKIAFLADRSEMFFNPKMTNEDFIHPGAIAVKVNGKWKFYNPGVSFLPEGMLTWYEEDVWALLVGEKDFIWVETPMTTTDKSNAKRTGKFKLLEDGTLEGDVIIEYTGQTALIERLSGFDKSENKRQEDFISEIKGRISTAEISGVSVSNVNNHRLPLTYKYKIKIPNYAQKTGKRMFFQPGFFEYGETPLFATGERKYDVYFQYPWSETDDVQIQMPDGYSLDNAESPGAFADNQKIGSLDINIKADKANNILFIDRKFHFGGGGMVFFPVGSYPAIKTMFDTFHKSDSHTISLKKKE
ncbi:MAG: DUF3857 domain-containing protein [Acidobacteriota bacterium]|nr:DUF3857 domain-containing protein [Acidobacteriota bacterium]